MMGFLDNFIATILVNDKPIREINNNGQRTCRLPFESEYKIRLKNKNNCRALVDISIDGTDVLNGKQLILNAYQTLDLERFLDELNGGSKFKFTSLIKGALTGEIQDPTSEDNGYIEIKFHKEIIPEYTITTSASDFPGWTTLGRNISSRSRAGGQSCYSSITGAAVDSGVTNNSFFCATNSTPNDLMSFDSALGATAEGSHSDQKFSKSTESFNTYSPTVISLRLVGQDYNTDSFGLYVWNRTSPERTFETRDAAYDFAMINDYGAAPVTIKTL